VEKGKLSRVVIPNMYSYSSLLRKYSKYFKYMNDLKGKLEYLGAQNTKKRDYPKDETLGMPPHRNT